MAKLKHSFLKNSLLFCYRNVLNTDSETGNSKNDINTLSESDDEYIKINEIKRIKLIPSLVFVTKPKQVLYYSDQTFLIINISNDSYKESNLKLATLIN